MGKRLVGFGHLVDVVLLLDGGAAEVHGVEDRAGQLVAHGALAAGGGVGLQPAHGQGHAAVLGNLHRHLVGGAAHAAGLDFHRGLDVVHGLLEGLHGLLAGFLGDDFQRSVEDALGGGLLAALHDDVHELGDDEAVVDGIREDLTLGGCGTASHGLPPYFFLAGAAPALGRLAPYLERDWLRPATPVASRVPRTTW